MQQQNLENAPKEIQLAVDLIYLLENTDLDPKTILKALAIVEQDFIKKQQPTEN